MSISANKGEWSELYVLFKLLAEQKIYSGDGNLNKLKAYYPILRIIRDELERRLEYSLDKDLVVVSENSEEIVKISVSEFLEMSDRLFARIQRGASGGGAFEIPELDDFLKKIHCERVKAKSADKADIHLVIHDYHTGLEPNLGFSIKSDAGSAPTLLNASTPTTFTFVIECKNMDDCAVDAINKIEGRRKLQDRVNAIVVKGGKLKFAGMPNSIFENNLRMIDSYLPEIIGNMLVDSYVERNMNIKDAVERLSKKNPLNFNMSGGHDHYGYKIKSLMVCTALGMLPSKPWTGRYEATGGYIVVKSSGDIICFHIYDRNMLEDYLYNNTKFETPKSGRYNMGTIYKKDGRLYFNLVLQIRFI